MRIPNLYYLGLEVEQQAEVPLLVFWISISCSDSKHDSKVLPYSWKNNIILFSQKIKILKDKSGLKIWLLIQGLFQFAKILRGYFPRFRRPCLFIFKIVNLTRISSFFVFAGSLLKILSLLICTLRSDFESGRKAVLQAR